MKTLTKLAAAGSALLLAGIANAVPINGSVALAGGDWRGIDDGGNWTTIAAATGIDFFADIDGEVLRVTGATGDIFTAVTSGGPSTPNTGTINDFWFKGPMYSLPVNPLYTFTDDDGYLWSFELVSVSVVLQDADDLVLSGTGYMSTNRPGLDRTFGDWGWTGQQRGSFSWSASSQMLPEPSSLALIGLGLLGVGLSRRRKV